MCAEWNEQPSNLKTMSLCQHNSILIALFKIKHKNFCMSKKSCPYLYRNLQTKNGPDFLDMQYSIPSWMNGSSHSGRHQPHPESGLYRVRISDGNSEIGANGMSNLCYLICLRHVIRSRVVTNRISLSEKNFLLMRAQYDMLW